MRRETPPIMLSSVWIEVGRRAGIEIDGIGMPGHFVARVGGRDGSLVDPFSGGCKLTLKQCQRIVWKLSNQALPWSDEYLRAVECDAIVERVLRNLMHVLRRCSDKLAMFKVARFHTALRPGQPEPLLLQACLAEQIGAHRYAMQLYDQVTARYPTSGEGRTAQRRRAKLVRTARSVH